MGVFIQIRVQCESISVNKLFCDKICVRIGCLALFQLHFHRRGQQPHRWFSNFSLCANVFFVCVLSSSIKYPFLITIKKRLVLYRPPKVRPKSNYLLSIFHSYHPLNLRLTNPFLDKSYLLTGLFLRKSDFHNYL